MCRGADEDVSRADEVTCNACKEAKKPPGMGASLFDKAGRLTYNQLAEP